MTRPRPLSKTKVQDDRLVRLSKLQAADRAAKEQRVARGFGKPTAPTDLLRELDSATYFGPGCSIDLAARASIFADPLVHLSAVAVDDAGDDSRRFQGRGIAHLLDTDGQNAVIAAGGHFQIGIFKGGGSR